MEADEYEEQVGMKRLEATWRTCIGFLCGCDDKGQKSLESSYKFIHKF